MSVTTDIQDGIAHIQMDDGKANAFSPDHIAALNDALDKAEADAKVFVVSGRPGRFSGGFDLKIMQGATPEEVKNLVRAGGLLNLRVFENKLPSVMAVTGHAMAQGAFFVMSADTRIGAQGDFKMGLPETAISMTLPQFGIELPKARLNPKYYTQAVIQAKNFNPDEAVEAGFLDMVVAPENLMETAMGTASMLAALPQHSYAANKMLIRQPYIDAIRASLA